MKETGAETEKVPGPDIASNVENCSNFLPSNWGSRKEETAMEEAAAGKLKRVEKDEWQPGQKLIKMLTSFLFTQQIAANAHKSNCSHHSMFAFAGHPPKIWDRGKIFIQFSMHISCVCVFFGVFKAALDVVP